MIAAVANLFNDRQERIRGRVIPVYALLLVSNAAAWRRLPPSTTIRSSWHGFACLHARPSARGRCRSSRRSTTSPASCCRRRAADAVGLFFSMGHSTIVVAFAALAVGARAIATAIPGFQDFGGYIGTNVSGAFLLIIGILNMIILVSVCRPSERAAVTSSRRGPGSAAQRGVLTRYCELLSPSSPELADVPAGSSVWPRLRHRLRNRPARNFGSAGSAGLPVWALLVFPALFTAAMTLIDTTDSILMPSKAWALSGAKERA